MTAASWQYSIGTTATQIVGVTPGIAAGPVAWFYAVNGTTPVYLGGASGVTSANGALLPANGTLSGFLWGSNQLYAVTASGSSVLGVLTTGA